MSWLLDTNVLLRLADDRSPEQAIAMTAVEYLLGRGASLYISTQVLVEFWSVATRPETANGFGWATPTATEAVHSLRDQFPILNEKPDVLDRWFELVDRCQVAGKRAHDARLAALLLVHGMKQLLTFNTADFPTSWGVEAAHPRQFVGTPTA